jgi:hypothetical protein
MQAIHERQALGNWRRGSEIKRIWAVELWRTGLKNEDKLNSDGFRDLRIHGGGFFAKNRRFDRGHRSRRNGRYCEWSRHCWWRFLWGFIARFDMGFGDRLSEVWQFDGDFKLVDRRFDKGHCGGFFVGFNPGSSGGLRIEDGQSDRGIDAGFNSGFDNGFLGDFDSGLNGDFDNGSFWGSDEGFDGRRCFDGVRLETFTFKLGFGRGIDRALFNDDMGRPHSHFEFLIQACHNSLEPLRDFSRRHGGLFNDLEAFFRQAATYQSSPTGHYESQLIDPSL